MAPSFACGRVLADAMLDRLISQAYFNPLVIPLFHALVASNDTTTVVSRHHGASQAAAPGSSGSVDSGGDANPATSGKIPFLVHVSVPVKMIGRTFAELFDYVLKKKGYVPVALYRAPVEHEQDTWEAAHVQDGVGLSRGVSESGSGGSHAKYFASPKHIYHKATACPGGTSPFAASRTSSHQRQGTMQSSQEWGVAWTKRGKANSFGEVVERNPLPYVYTAPIPSAIVNKDDTVMCLTSGQTLVALPERPESWS